MSESSHNSSGRLRAVLIAEDESYGRRLERQLVSDLIDCLVFQEADSAMTYLLGEDRCDAILVDGALPSMLDGEWLKEYFRGGGNTPVTVFLDKPDPSQCARLLDHGAEDFVTKPVDVQELVARIHCARRRKSFQMTRWRVGDWVLDCVNHTAEGGGSRVDLSPKKFAFLATLARADGDHVERRELLQQIWGLDMDPGTRILEVLASRLRGKLKPLQGWSVNHDLGNNSYALLFRSLGSDQTR